MNWEEKTMQSKTSLFNSAVLRDGLRRTAPAWSAFFGFWLVILPLVLVMEHGNYVADVYATRSFDLRVAEYLCDMIATGAPVVSFFYGLLIAMMLFNTLYTNRSAVGVHSLPVTRAQLFFNYWLAALAAVAVPMALVCLLTLPLLLFWNTGCLAELGLLFVSMVGSFIWNFSFAAFCAMFTGQIFWLPVFYGIIVLLPYAVAAVWEWLCEMLLFGYNYRASLLDKVNILSPGFYLMTGAIEQGRVEDTRMPYITTASMGRLGAIVLAGLVLAGITLVLYKRRQLETAGEIVTYPVMRMVFRVGVGICTGAVSLLFFQEVTGSETSWALWGFTLPGVVLGVVVAEMLVKKSIHILSQRLVLECGFDFVILGLIVGLLATGGLGYETRVPAADKVSDITLLIDGLGGPVTVNGAEFVFTDEEDILALTELHKTYIEGGREQEFDFGGGYDWEASEEKGLTYGTDYTNFGFSITYRLSGGRQLTRSYSPLITREMLDDPASFSSLLQAFITERCDLAAQLRRVRDTAAVDAWNDYIWEDEEDTPAVEFSFSNASRNLEAGHPATLKVLDSFIAELEYKGGAGFDLLGGPETPGEHWTIHLYYDAGEDYSRGYVRMNIVSEDMPRTAYALRTAPEYTGTR